MTRLYKKHILQSAPDGYLQNYYYTLDFLFLIVDVHFNKFNSRKNPRITISKRGLIYRFYEKITENN